MNAPLNVAILLFDDVEVLDFAGPFEVFSSTKLPDQSAPFKVFTCAEQVRPILARGQLSINPQYSLANCPAPHVLVVPGGWGTREQLGNASLINWIRTTAQRADLVFSVCTGALLLAKAGLLQGLSATTHHQALELLPVIEPTVNLRRFERFVDQGRVLTAAGISAGIDASLHIVAKLAGSLTADSTAKYMEYDWAPT